MNTHKESQKLSNLWIGPLLAGSCLATGYEVTQRVMIVHSKSKEPVIELFKTPTQIPGKGVEALHHLHRNITTTTLVNEKSKSFTQITDDQANKMQSMLDALEMSWIDFETTQPKKSSSQINKQKIKTSKNLRKFDNQAIDKLFKSLQAPELINP